MTIFRPISLNLLIVLLSHQIIATNSVKYRIVGGRPMNIGEAKYIVSLRERDGKFFCGGTLVDDRYVVTAAHCVKGMRKENIMVHGGVAHLTESGVTRSVVRMIVPQAFSLKTSEMDVAILKLSSPMVGDNITTLPLCSRRLPPRSWVKVSGWGLINQDAAEPSTQLRTVNVRMLGHNKCARNYRSVLKLSKTMMCGGIPGKKDSCIGDSGGPLVYKGELCGIVSFGVGCADSKFPGVYTSVNAVLKFIVISLGW